jgi:hypothetical protein
MMSKVAAGLMLALGDGKIISESQSEEDSSLRAELDRTSHIIAGLGQMSQLMCAGRKGRLFQRHVSYPRTTALLRSYVLIRSFGIFAIGCFAAILAGACTKVFYPEEAVSTALD